MFRIPTWPEDNLPSFEYFINIALTTSLRKAGWGRESSSLSLLMLYKYPGTLKSNIHHSNEQGPSPFFHSDTSPVVGHVLFHSVDKTHILVVKVELTWLLFLNIIYFNFAPTPNRSLRLTKFCFFAWCALFKVAAFLFLQMFVPSDSGFA